MEHRSDSSLRLITDMDAEETLVRIAEALDEQIVGDDVWRYSDKMLALIACRVLHEVNEALLDYREGWAFDEAERRETDSSGI